MSDLAWLPLVELARMIAAKAVSPVDVVRAHLGRIAKLDATLKAFITVCADEALDAARRAEAELAAGQASGPLHGVPIGLKDLFHTAGVRTTGGSRILADFVPTQDATAVRRLRQAGAIVLGKLNMHEFAYGPEGLNEHYGHARNPWDAGTTRIAGGSSSGSAVAVAAGLVPGALGSDTGGSIRIPAALCGITGLKPTYGRISRHGVLPLAWSMDHAGPMARTAADCALMLGCLAGYDPGDATTSVLPVPHYPAALTGDVKGVRVGLLRKFFLEAAAPEVRGAVETAAEVLRGLGATVDEVELPSIGQVAAASFAIVAAEALAYHAEWLRTRAADYQPDVRERLRLGAFVSGVHYIRGQQVRALVRGEVDQVLARREVLLAPATPIPATALGERQTALGDGAADVRSVLSRLTRPFNFSGHPACALPCGFTAAGLPVGMQIVGRPFDEATVLRVADAFQRATDWHRRRPVLSSEGASTAPSETAPRTRMAPAKPALEHESTSREQSAMHERPAVNRREEDGWTRGKLDERLSALEARLGRLEALLGRIDEGVAGARLEVDAAKTGLQRWVTEYVSLRLQQLVPETCEHAPEPTAAAGPVLPGTRVRCTDEVLHRLGRIPIPFVRQMVTQKVAETARVENVGLVDVAFFERAATF